MKYKLIINLKTYEAATGKKNCKKICKKLEKEAKKEMLKLFFVHKQSI